MFFIVACVVSSASALTISCTSGQTLFVDTRNGVNCSYASFQVGNDDAKAYSNLWLTAGSFSGPMISLAGNDPGLYPLGNMSVGKTNTAFFYLKAIKVTRSSESYNVVLYQGNPRNGGTPLLTNVIFMTAQACSQNSSAKIDGATVMPNPPVLGGLFDVTLTGNSGTIGGANSVNFTPAVYLSWDAASYRMVSSVIIASGGNVGTYSNTLLVTFPTSKNTIFTNRYTFRAVAVAPSNSISPLFVESGCGGNYNHAPPPAAGMVQSISLASNTAFVVTSASVSQLYTNQAVTFTVTFTNSSPIAITLDAVADTLPSGFSYVEGSSLLDGVPLNDPTISNRLLKWTQPYTVAGTGTGLMTFQAVPVVSGYATNSVVAYSQDTVIDTTCSTIDNMPATTVVRVLLTPIAGNDAVTAQQNTERSVSPPGVLTNDTDANGFSLQVASFVQPSHGSVTVSKNGAFVYMPSTNYNGADAFTYTVTNGNNGSTTAILNVNVLPPAAQTITFPTIVAQLTTNTVRLGATASSGLSVGFAVESGLASISNGSNLTFTGSGTVGIIAVQQGDNAYWSAATPVTNNFMVSKAMAEVLLGNLSGICDGTAKTVSVTTLPTNLTVIVSYDGNAIAPTNAGSYTIIGTISDAGYAGSATNMLVIKKAIPTVTLEVNNSLQTYDGTGKSATVRVTASSVLGAVSGILTGGAASQTNAGTYAVTADFLADDAINYSNLLAQAAGNFVITKSTPDVTSWPTASAITYRQTLASSTLSNGAATVAGSFAFTTPSAMPAAGTALQDVTFMPTDATNYACVTGSVNVTVNLALSTLEIRSLYGIGTLEVGFYTNTMGSVLTNYMANPEAAGCTQYVCKGWSMDGSEPACGVTTQCVMTVTNNAVLTWLWATNYYLNTAAVPNGSITIDSGWQPMGVTTQITAVAALYYHFANWSGDAGGASNILELLMDVPKSVTAKFAANYTSTHPTPEWWMAKHGITTEFDKNSLDDTDHDGLANWQEYVAGTDPTNASSRLVITAIGPALGTNYTETVHFYAATNNVTHLLEDNWVTQRVYQVIGHSVTWPGATGRIYNVEYSTNLFNWFDLDGATNLPGRSPDNTITDLPTLEVKFYRVKVRLP